MNHDNPGVLYTETALPATTAADVSSIAAILTNPFRGNAKIVSCDLYPVAAITGDDTNSQNFNLMLANGTTEIGQLDFPAAVNGVIGTKKAFTLSGTAAQLTIAADGAVTIQIEDVGDQPGLIYGHRIRIGWKGI